jgi:hypothetical protein
VNDTGCGGDPQCKLDTHPFEDCKVGLVVMQRVLVTKQLSNLYVHKVASFLNLFSGIDEAHILRNYLSQMCLV